ncbi:MAG: hypothetical protein ACYCTF_07060 [Acidiferrobacter sp.]
MALRDGVATLLADDANRRYYRFLDLAGLEPRSPRLRVPVVLAQEIAWRIASSVPTWSALILEISAQRIGARLVAGKPPIPEGSPQKADSEGHQAFVGRDFGYANTVALSVAVADAPADLQAIVAALDGLDGKDRVRAFLESQALSPAIRIIERVRYSGRKFLAKVADLSGRIDGYRARIDLAYNHLRALREGIIGALKLDDDARIEKEMKHGPCGERMRAFFPDTRPHPRPQGGAACPVRPHHGHQEELVRVPFQYRDGAREKTSGGDRPRGPHGRSRRKERPSVQGACLQQTHQSWFEGAVPAQGHAEVPMERCSRGSGP